MPELTPQTLEPIIRRHRPDLTVDISFEPITTGKFNTSFFVRAGDEEMVLRIAPPSDSIFVFYERDMMRQEKGIHDLVLARTSAPVAEIYAYDNSHELIDRDLLLMKRLPGQALSETAGADYNKVLRQVGAYMAEVHALTAEKYGYLGPHRPMEPQQTWPAAFQIMWNNLIDDIVSVGHYNPDENRLLRGLLDKHIRLFDSPTPSCLLHMDIWSQNILVDREWNVTGLVDWDRALWGDPEIEFAVLDYCGISEPPFWKGYGKQRDTSHEAQIRQIFYLLYELQKYIVIRQGRGHDPHTARAYKQHVMQIVERQLPS